MQNVLVVGGNGFVGRAIVDDLLNYKNKLQVHVLDIRKHKDFDEDASLASVKFHIADLCDEQQVKQILEQGKIDTVFHCATPAPFSPDSILKKVNIDGTVNLLNVCRQCKVKRFILTSSASVIYHGQAITNADETYPYAKAGYNTYTDTKIAQEKIVLEANGKDDMFTVALRPSSIFGPRDELFFPAVITAAKAGRTNKSVGDGTNEYDFTYVKNVSYAHILAAEKIYNNKEASGQAFFITNNERIKFWKFLGDISEAVGGPRPKFAVPHSIFYVICLLIAFIYWIVNLCGFNAKVPLDVSFDKLAYFTYNRTFSSEKARKLLGYEPIYTVKQGFDEAIAYFKKLEASNTTPSTKKQQ